METKRFGSGVKTCPILAVLNLGLKNYERIRLYFLTSDRSLHNLCHTYENESICITDLSLRPRGESLQNVSYTVLKSQEKKSKSQAKNQGKSQSQERNIEN